MRTFGAPIGTRQELDELNLNPVVVPCCGPHIREKQIGCMAYDYCNLAEREKSGPIFVAAQQYVATHDGPRRSVDVKLCMAAMLVRQMLKENGGLLKIVGREGDKVMVPGSKKILSTVPGEQATWQKCEFEVTVPRFLRPKETEDFKVHAEMLAEQRKQSADEERRTEAQFIGAATGESRANAERSRVPAGSKS